MAQFLGVKSHTILLMEIHEGRTVTKEYSSLPSFDAALDEIFAKFEKQLEEMNQTQDTIQYGIADLENYIRSFGDLTAMVLDGSTLQYQGVSTNKIFHAIKTRLAREADA